MTQPNDRGQIKIALSTYQIEAAFLELHGEAVDLLRLEVTGDSCPDPSSNFLVYRCLIGHPACLEISRQDTEAHLIHPERSRHQREYPSMMDRRENERSGQAFLTQRLHGIEVGAKS